MKDNWRLHFSEQSRLANLVKSVMQTRPRHYSHSPIAPNSPTGHRPGTRAIAIARDRDSGSGSGQSQGQSLSLNPFPAVVSSEIRHRARRPALTRQSHRSR